MSDVADCYARAAIGQAIADPRPAMNSLRRIVHASRAAAGYCGRARMETDKRCPLLAQGCGNLAAQRVGSYLWYNLLWCLRVREGSP
jgi:hypothetical protein